jgi:ATP-dependent DNA ligase
MDLSKLSSQNGFLVGKAGDVDADIATKVAGYKKNVAKNFISLNPGQIDTRLAGTQFWVTRKYDGELAVICFDGEQVAIVNSGGTMRSALPCTEQAAKALKAAGIAQALIPAELHVDAADSRGRVFEVTAALADGKSLDSLGLAVFDIVELNGEPYRSQDFGETYAELTRIFTDSSLCKPVECQKTESRSQVRDIFEEWVTDSGGEGLVVRTELPLVFKIKPRHSLDLAVIGFSEGLGEARGTVRSLLVALQPEEGVYQVVGHVGGGIPQELRAGLFAPLSAKEVASDYIETDANHVAFHMVEPELVIEAALNDVLYENVSGVIINPTLEFSDGKWRRTGQVTGMSLVFPTFERVRDDKAPTQSETRLAQLDAFAAPPTPAAAQADAGLAKSTLVRREVYTKTLGEKLMVLKFMSWATNKAAQGWPAYVLSVSNFSSDRKDPLTYDVKISSDESQITELFDQALAENVKKGWVKA